ncbi:MAG: hypothetical protein ACXABY_28700 [Candidatus Thorarchaeota archaeon]|jgi:hypothetical protein
MRIDDTIELEDEVTIGAGDDGTINISDISDNIGFYNPFLNDASFVNNDGDGGDITIKAGNSFGAGFGDVTIQDGSGRARIEMKDGNIHLIGKQITLEPESKEEERKLGKVTVVDESRLDDFKEEEPEQFKYVGVYKRQAEREKKRQQNKEPPKSTDWFLKRTSHYHNIKAAREKIKPAEKFDVMREVPTHINLDATNQTDSDKFHEVAKKVTESARVDTATTKVMNDRVEKTKSKLEPLLKNTAKDFKTVKGAIDTLNKYAKVLEEDPTTAKEVARKVVNSVPSIDQAKAIHRAFSGVIPPSINQVAAAIKSNPQTTKEKDSRPHGSPDGGSFWRSTKDEDIGLRYNNIQRKAKNQEQIEEAVNKYIDDVAKKDENYRKLMADVLRRDVEVRKIIKSFNHSKSAAFVTKRGEVSEVAVNLNKDIEWQEPEELKPEKIAAKPRKMGMWTRIRKSVGKWLSK